MYDGIYDDEGGRVVRPYEHLTWEQLAIRTKLMAETVLELMEEMDRRDGKAQGRKTRGGLRVIDGGKS